MNKALIQTLLEEPSQGQVFGGIMMILLFASVGIILAIALTMLARRIFLGRYEQFFWSLLLVGIAAIYLGFSAWFQVSHASWSTELAGIALFVAISLVGAFSAPALALGYLMHGVWDLAHSIYGTLLAGYALSDIPLGYGMFCAGVDWTAAAYLAFWPKNWNQPAAFRPLFGKASFATANPPA